MLLRYCRQEADLPRKDVRFFTTGHVGLGAGRGKFEDFGRGGMLAWGWLRQPRGGQL